MNLVLLIVSGVVSIAGAIVAVVAVHRASAQPERRNRAAHI